MTSENEFFPNYSEHDDWPDAKPEQTKNKLRYRVRVVAPSLPGGHSDFEIGSYSLGPTGLLALKDEDGVVAGAFAAGQWTAWLLLDDAGNPVLQPQTD